MAKNQKRSFLLFLAFLSGLSIFIYPSVSDYLAKRNVIRGANTYEQKITQLSDEVVENMWKEARAYNDSLNGNPVPDPFIPGSGRVLPENYRSVLDMGGGIMGYIDIPNIRVYLPIYHGAAEKTLEQGAGHIEQTTLPIGGIGNLSILTAHTGFTGAEMFDRLIELIEGDIFRIHVLNETFTYEVDDIRVILPEEIESLVPVRGKDYVTLVTCTPYGVNTHRLLVRGSRIENIEIREREIQEVAFPWEVFRLIVIACLLFAFLLIWNRRREKRRVEEDISEVEIKRAELIEKMQWVARRRSERRNRWGGYGE